MQGKDYVALAMRTYDDKGTERLLKKLKVLDNLDIGGMIEGALGLGGEAGEVMDILKKWLFHEHSLDIDHLELEISDVMWYVALLCYCFGFDLDEIYQKNIDKLKARYPEGFDAKRSVNRVDGDV